MALITLTTDLGLKDHYVGLVKGKILKDCPEVTLVDITHLIPPYDILQAAFTLKNSYAEFPEGSIHIIGVNPEVNEHTPHLLIKYQNHYFIGADNGVFSLIFTEPPEQVFEINISNSTDMFSFPTKDIFATAACHLAKGGTPEMIGKPVNEIQEKMLFRAVSMDNVIKGMVQHIDHYGNIITNIEDVFFKSFGQGREFNIEFQRGGYDIDTLSRAYSDVPEGEKLAMFSSSGLLEIAINKGNASKLLGMRVQDTIRVEFYDR
jgi:S-adenosylmethionine hydrolase